MIDSGPKLSLEHDGFSWTSVRIGQLPLIRRLLAFSLSCLFLSYRVGIVVKRIPKLDVDGTFSSVSSHAIMEPLKRLNA